MRSWTATTSATGCGARRRSARSWSTTANPDRSCSCGATTRSPSRASGATTLPGTDHVAFGVTDPLLRQGRFAGRDDAGTVFDDSVFTTGPFASVDISWIERTPSVFDVAVEWGAVARVARRRTDPEGDRESLRALLQARIDRLRGAGVVGRVQLRPLREVQASLDRLTVLSPAATEEQASTGEDRLVATGAIFDETPRERGRLA